MIAFLRRLFGLPPARDPGEVYAALRSQILTLAPEALGPTPQDQELLTAPREQADGR